PDRTDSAGRRTADVGAQTPRPLLRVRTLRRLHHPHDRAEHLRDWSETVNGWRLALSEADDLAVGRGADAPHRIRVVIADDNPAFCHAWQRVIDADPDMTASRRLAMRHRAGGDPAAGSSIFLIGAFERDSASAS